MTPKVCARRIDGLGALLVHKPRAHCLDRRLADFDGKLERTFGKENFARPVSLTRDGRLAALEVTGPRNPGAYYLFDVAANTANLIGVQSKQITPSQMGMMRPIVYAARDGVKINAYFTTPPGNPPHPPLVVMPHGGPEARDYAEWWTTVQFLATRGYAVLQPNFRGSDGFGKKFAESGYKQWGLKMQDDITDSVRHVVEQGLVDPERICIYGASYGGYAALAGAAFTPEYYKCAISVTGVSDLYDLMRWERNRQVAYHYWKKSIGDLRDAADKARMKDRSPIEHVDGISVPILIISGEDDDTVPVEQSRDMANALEKVGKPYKYIEFEKEGHTILQYENRKREFQEVEAFLTGYIGGKRKNVPAEPAAASAVP